MVGHRSKWFAVTALVATATVALASCSSSGSPGSNKTGASSANSGEPAPNSGGATPKSGGTLVVGEYSGVNSLDPMQGTGSVTIGGNETLALYGTLMRWDPEKLEAVPYLAESLSHNDDYTQWTVKLRPDMVFSDGTPYNAAAVLKNWEREKKSFFSIATSFALVSSMKATDDLTVEVTLKQPNSDFAYGLSTNIGMIAAPSYTDKVDAGDKTAAAVGAGPFMVKDFKPGTSVTLVPNPKYAFDKPYLSTLKFQLAGTEDAQLQAFEAGQLQAGIVLDSHGDIEIKNKKIPTVASKHTCGVAILLNNRKNSPLHDVRLRQAIQLAYNPKVWNERNNAGEDVLQDVFFQKDSIFYSADQEKIPYDPAKAKQLVDQVKADSDWNGTLNWVGPSTQTNQVVIMSSMLNPIGIKLNATNLPVASYYQKVYADHAFDLAGGGGGVLDATPFASLYTGFVAPTNTVGYSNPEMAQIANEMGEASTLAERKAVMAKFLALFMKTTPYLCSGTTTWNFFHKENVKGLEQVGGYMMQFDKAWIS